MTGRASVAIVLLGQLVVVAPKCIPYIGGGSPDSGAQDASSFVPATPCASPSEAQMRVESFAFNVVCGCAEARGTTCTIPRGTTVVWTFADSEEHNVTSVRDVAGSFGMSPDRLTGRFEHVFAEPGTFHYGCTIHPKLMSGYSIVVLE